MRYSYLQRGFRSGTIFYDGGDIGCYWSSSSPINEYHVYHMFFYSGYLEVTGYNERFVGFSVRPVRNVE